MYSLPLFMCSTLAIFFIVESIFDSVFSSSLPKSSSMLRIQLKNQQQQMISKSPSTYSRLTFLDASSMKVIYNDTYTACSSSSTLICRDTVFNVPIESLITSNCSSCVCTMRCCNDTLSPRNRCDGLSNADVP